ncbi:cation-transporting P-type ATPase [Actinomadura nitritigenes]|uniref:Cation-transporting P-type ATPase n=1 Tax=Actinomadura nitritigenes TaxID=134602 RepID=A0ABS3QY92_9ACTN|nr:cation-transporting P-type ATPase [Actinomadura nitritigenes]MBO2438972.1 cation-transporting P-type ATPase [Actinomadura nitritigenes]
MITKTTPPAARRGLTSAEAAARLRADGPNLLPAKRPPSPLLSLAGQLVHFFALLLWAAAALAYAGGMPQLAVAIVVVIVVNGVFAFAQEYRAERAGRRLRELLPARAAVRRDGHRTMIDTADLVVGDVVLLEAGDRVSADLELLAAHALAVDESTLTGESVPVRPEAGARVHAGTFVTEGEAEAEVTATGARTRLAGIAALTRAARRRPSPLAGQLRRVVQAVAGIAVTVGAAFFGVAMLLGMAPGEGFLLAVGVTVALVPEGLLPTVTLSLARAAQRMAGRRALVRRLEAVETLGSTTFICTDKTGTLTRNEMTAVRVWTPSGTVRIEGGGYGPDARLLGEPAAVEAVRALAISAYRCSTGRTRRQGGRWRAVGDPMEAALHALALRAGSDLSDEPELRRYPFDARRRRSSSLTASGLHLKGAPDSVLPRCAAVPGAEDAVTAMTEAGLRVLAVAVRPPRDLPGDLPDGLPADPGEAERGLTLLGLVGLQDPPRHDVAAAVADCHRAGIRLAMITGDHPATARAVAAEVGLARPGSPVVTGADLPRDDADLGRLLDRDGAVVARVTPEDKLRIARALQARGHVVAMTGDGVNDGPALRQADIGVAMGASGTDVAREAADLVLLDDHFGTIVAAVELGRATFSNIRRFLTYHLTDNVAELVPFAAWAVTGGRLPLALGVLQVLALDIGTDILPALALGAEPAGPGTMRGRVRRERLIDRGLLGRVFGVLGPVEAAVTMAAFAAVLAAGGWSWGETPSDGLLFTASGTAFATIMLGQMATAFCCRSESRWAARLRWNGNPLLLWAVAADLVLMAVFLGVPPVAHLLGGGLPSALGWPVALAAVPAVLLADTAAKTVRGRGAPAADRPAPAGARPPR